MPLNPMQYAIQNNVRLDHATGSIHIADFFTTASHRQGLADHYLLQSMLAVIPTQTDSDTIYDEFYALGKLWGRRFFDTLQTRIDETAPDSIKAPQDYLKDEFVEHLNSYFSYSGIGQFRITEGNQFYMIELKNPWRFTDDAGNAYLIVLFAGFFAELFGLVAAKALACNALSVNDNGYRFALSQEPVIQEIRSLFAAGKNEHDILSQFNNQHMM